MTISTQYDRLIKYLYDDIVDIEYVYTYIVHF